MLSKHGWKLSQICQVKKSHKNIYKNYYKVRRAEVQALKEMNNPEGPRKKRKAMQVDRIGAMRKKLEDFIIAYPVQGPKAPHPLSDSMWL